MGIECQPSRRPVGTKDSKVSAADHSAASFDPRKAKDHHQAGMS